MIIKFKGRLKDFQDWRRLKRHYNVWFWTGSFCYKNIIETIGETWKGFSVLDILVMSEFCCFYSGNNGECSQEIYIKVFGDDETYYQIVQENNFPTCSWLFKILILIKTKK